MNRKFQLLYLIEQYRYGQYDTTTFSSQMERIYYIEKDDSLSQEDMEILAPLAHCAEYFSPYQEDREQYKGFTNEDTVKKTAEEAYRKLLCHYKMDSFDELIKQSIEEDG